MTDAPFALPLRFAPDEVYGPEYGWIVDANEYCPWGDMNDKTTADFLIRAVNSYAKMREALRQVAAFEGQLTPENFGEKDNLATAVAIARTILKEIDNG